MAGVYSSAPAQVYEFSKPNVPVNDDSLGRHHHFNTSQGQHSVAFRGDTMYAVWWDYRQPGNPNNSDVYFARSTDSGLTFLPNIRVNDNTDTTSLQQEPCLCLDKQGVIHIAWDDTRLGECRIFYTRSTDGGRSFLSNQRVNDTLGSCSMVSSNGRGIVCVAWWNGMNIFLSTSSDSGRTFGRKVVVNDAQAYNIDNASLALDSIGRAYVAWPRYPTPHIYLSRSTNPGDTLFYPSMRVSDSVPRVWAAESPSLAVGKGGRVYVALLDKRNTGQALHVYVAKSTNGGASFLPNIDVSDDTLKSGQRWPSIAADDSGNVYVAWTDYRNGYRCIYFARSTDPGDTAFSPNILVNDTAGLSGTDRYGASLAVNELGEAFVTWSDNRVSRSIQLYDIFSAKGVRQTSGVESNGIPFDEAVKWGKCYPNPFTSGIKLNYSVNKIGGVRLAIYNLLGEEVVALENSTRVPGEYTTEWKGVDKSGRKVKPGVYFIKVSYGDYKTRLGSPPVLQRITLLR